MFQVSTRHACHYTNIWWYKEKLVQKKKKKTADVAEQAESSFEQ